MTTTITLIDLYKGESDYRTFLYKIDGVAVDLSTLEDIRLLFSDEKGLELARYSWQAATDWNSADFLIISAIGGTFGVKIQASETINWSEGVASLEIQVKKTLSGFAPDFESIYKEFIYNVLPSKIAAL